MTEIQSLMRQVAQAVSVPTWALSSVEFLRFSEDDHRHGKGNPGLLHTSVNTRSPRSKQAIALYHEALQAVLDGVVFAIPPEEKRQLVERQLALHRRQGLPVHPGITSASIMRRKEVIEDAFKAGKIPEVMAHRYFMRPPEELIDDNAFHLARAAYHQYIEAQRDEENVGELVLFDFLGADLSSVDASSWGQDPEAAFSYIQGLELIMRNVETMPVAADDGRVQRAIGALREAKVLQQHDVQIGQQLVEVVYHAMFGESKQFASSDWPLFYLFGQENEARVHEITHEFLLSIAAQLMDAASQRGEQAPAVIPDEIAQVRRRQLILASGKEQMQAFLWQGAAVDGDLLAAMVEEYYGLEETHDQHIMEAWLYAQNKARDRQSLKQRTDKQIKTKQDELDALQTPDDYSPKGDTMDKYIAAVLAQYDTAPENVGSSSDKDAGDQESTDGDHGEPLLDRAHADAEAIYREIEIVLIEMTEALDQGEWVGAAEAMRRMRRREIETELNALQSTRELYGFVDHIDY